MSLKRMVAYEDGDLEIARNNGHKSFYFQFNNTSKPLPADICPYSFPAFQMAWWMGFLNEAFLCQRMLIRSIPWNSDLVKVAKERCNILLNHEKEQVLYGKSVCEKKKNND